jgi:erythromycin esterase-like protein
MMTTTSRLDTVRDAAHILTGDAGDYDPLMELIGDARFVLLGEASHGTHDFYAERCAITRRLILEKGFTAIAVEADWPDAYQVNRYVMGKGDSRSADEALNGFERFPTWMWRNTVVRDFVEWLRLHNAGAQRKSGFYGLDLYSLYRSVSEVITYLDRVDPEGARRARQRYACFEQYADDSQEYGFAAGLGITRSCEDDVVKQLVELRRKAGEYLGADGDEAADEFFFAEQNARLVQNAEEYYRTMFRGHISSWNLRDSHMAETLDALYEHLCRRDPEARIVVWAHNSHLGDASATESGRRGEHNLGQLTRAHHRNDVRLIGFTTNTGTVTAASDWDRPAERKQVRHAMEGSYERLLHQTGIPKFLLLLEPGSAVAGVLSTPLLERAIGVVYRPETERMSHYFHASLPSQFDAIIHCDTTTALRPLEPEPGWLGGEEFPETYPSAL